MNLLIRHLIALVIVTVAFVPTYLDASQQAYIPEKYRGIILNAPEPDFPASTELRQLGQGIYRLIINPKTGLADEVKVLQSSSAKKLDAVAVMAFMQWKFKPGALKEIDIPLSFLHREITADLRKAASR
jgi:outer membrane biosynthesis protein TonB